MLLLILLALLLPMTVQAQQAPTEPTRSDSLREVRLSPIVVTATRSARELEDVAAPTTVVAAGEMKARGAVRLSDVLAEVTGLALFDDHGTGVQIQGFASDYTLILLDGEPVIGRTAGTLNLDRLTVSGLERVEIVRGPSSSLYGSDALAGVINLIPQSPSDGFAASVRTRYGTHNATHLATTVEGGTEQVSARLLVDRFSSGGYDLTPDVFGETAPRFADYTADLRLHIAPTDRTSLRLGARVATENQERAFASAEEGFEVLQDETGSRVDWSLHPEVRHRLSNRLHGELSLYAARYASDTQMTRRIDGVKTYTDDFIQTYGKAEIQLNAIWNQRHLTMAGGGFIREGLDGTRYEEEPSANSGFGFVQHEWMPSRRLDVNVSARFDAHEDYHWRLSPKAALLLRLSDRLRLRASLGSGFKAPDFRQLYLVFTNAAAGYSVFGSTRLAEGLAQLQASGQLAEIFIDPSGLSEVGAETSMAYNLGFSSEPLRWLSLRMNGFYNDVHDLIETQPVAQKTSGQFVYGYFNINRIYTRGVEAEVTVMPTSMLDGLMLSAGYQFLQARDPEIVAAIRRGEVFGRTPGGRDYRLTLSDYGGLIGRSPHSGTIGATWRQVDHDLTLNVRGTWRSSYGYRDLDGNGVPNRSDERVPAYAVWDATLTKGWAVPYGERVTLQVGVENAFDVVRPSLIPSMPGRLLYVGLEWTL